MYLYNSIIDAERRITTTISGTSLLSNYVIFEKSLIRHPADNIYYTQHTSLLLAEHVT